MAKIGIAQPSGTEDQKARFSIWFSRYWLFVFIIFYGIFVILPFMAPVLMSIGWGMPARVIYGIYSFLCHQLPERSYFLFGEKFTYSLAEIQSVWPVDGNVMLLRRFIGNPDMGWKVAWSDRMISFYGGVWLMALAWGAVKSRIKRISVWLFVLLALPMFMDGATHFISDLAGIGQGFRFYNTWLPQLTGLEFPSAFLAGDAWGSLNSILRLVTGALFGFGLVWYGFPYIEELFRPRPVDSAPAGLTITDPKPR